MLLTKASINHFSANLHNLNDPGMTFLAVAFILATGFFVFFKDRKSEINQVFLLFLCAVSIWFTGNAMSMLFYNNFELGFLAGTLIGYAAVPFFPALYYHFFIVFCNKKKTILPFLYFIGFVQVFLLWFLAAPYGKIGARILPYVGVVWEEMHPFYFSLYFFGMIYYITLSFLTGLSFLHAARQETSQIMKQRLKLLAVAFFSLMGGGIEWLVIFGIDLHISWLVTPIFISVIAFSIIRYRFLDIETVIHRTLLWLLTSCFVAIPIGLLFRFFHASFLRLAWWQMALAFTFFFFLIIPYHQKIQARIDHVFRRKRYDAYEALGKIGSRLAKEVDIVSITRMLFSELKNTLYIRNALLLMKIEDESIFEEVGRMGFENLEKSGFAIPGPHVVLAEQSALISWFRTYLKALGRNQLDFDPAKKDIKREILDFLDVNVLEVMIPIVLEGELKGLLCLGKKETLGIYTDRDIQLLENLGQHISLVLNSSLRHRDLMEKELLNNVTEGIDEALMLLDKDENIFWTNAIAAKIFETEKIKIMGRRCCDVIKFTTPENFSSLKEAAVKGAPKVIMQGRFDKNGQEHFDEFSLHAIRNNDGGVKYFLFVGRDLTHRIALEKKLKNNYEELALAHEKLKETQAQLIQTSKMASIGQLASGVAHEINNPLTGVLNNVELIKMDLESKADIQPSEFKELLEAIEKSAQRCKKITQSLLDFSSMAKSNFHPVVLNDVIEITTDLVLLELRLRNIALEKDLTPGLPLVQGNFQLLQQVVYNMLINSKWAIEKKLENGKIILKTYYDSDAKCSCFSVSDTGIGISKENLGKIFDPFFTTKEVGEGTGLGLSIVYGIIKEHNGTLEVTSEIGKGTTFTVRIPSC